MLVAVGALMLLLLGCDSDRQESADAVDTAAARDTADSQARQGDALEAAAEDIVRFLAGDAAFEALHVADSVELFVAPEGGGTQRTLSREALRDRHAWTVDAGGQRYSFTPRATLTRMTVSVGTHFNCRPVDLASRVPALGHAPHVGVRLEPPDADSCLQTWNVTFVFDTTAARPRLTAAVYDQWEW
jgi:hypothetical protein